MPAFATHEIFGQEAVDGIASDKLHQVVQHHLEVFRLGCQGPDIFFFHPVIRKGCHKINMGSKLHKTEINRFFEEFLQELLLLRSRFGLDTGISYFLGFLSHYALDTHIHPYVYSKIGYEADNPDSASRTLPAHQRLEAIIDKKMLMAKRNCMPSAYYPDKRMQVTERELSVIAGLLSRTLRKVYHIALHDTNIKLSYRSMRLAMRHIYDHTGTRRQRICAFESAVLCRPVIANMIVADTLPDRIDAMNIRGRVWRNPWNQDEAFDSSVWELYDNAVEQYQEYINVVEPVLQGMFQRMCLLEQQKSRAGSAKKMIAGKIPEIIGGLENKSYHSGQ